MILSPSMNVYHASSRICFGNKVKIYHCRWLHQQQRHRWPLLKNCEQRHAFSLSTTDDDDKSSSRLKQAHFEKKWTLLYHRNPSRNTYPRAFFGISTFNLLYWTWYVVDFTPAINLSAQTKFDLGKIDPATLEMLVIDPNMGYIGLGVSSVIWLGAFLYSRQLVSAIWATQPICEEDGRLAVATLKLPFLSQPKILLKTVFDPESNNFEGSVQDIPFTEADINSTSSVKIFAPGDLALCEDKMQHDAIVKYDGDFRRLRGHIALKKADESDVKKGPLAAVLDQKFLLDIHATEEVMPHASATLGYHLFNGDYRLMSEKRVERIDTKRSGGKFDDSVTKERRKKRLSSDFQRPISQLEIARGTFDESLKRKNDRGKRS